MTVAEMERPSMDRTNADDPLQAVFSPKSIAVLGVTPTPGTVPHDIFSNLVSSGYTGPLYPVAPGKREICSVKAYRYVLDVEGEIDLAVIVFPAAVVEKALQQCADKGVRAAIVISAGFRETGAKGLQMEHRIRDLCADNGIALVGPNCLGAINTDPKISLNASFARKMPAEGRIAFLSQSGALCTAVLDYARGKNIGFSKFVSFGNMAGVTEIDLLQFLHRDPSTDVILMYLEELRNGRGLIDAAGRITRGDGAKPILAIKSGRTPQGADAASSHTGSLAGEDAVCDAVFGQAGIVRVNSIEELFNTAVLLADQPMAAGNRLGIVTNAGGPGVMATDAAVAAGLDMPRFDDRTAARLAKALPAAANMKNPVDVIGDARSDRYEAALTAVLDDANVDQVLVILTPQSMTDIEQIARGVVQVEAAADKPIVCSFMGAVDVAPGVEILQAAHIPHYILPEWACRAMGDVQRVRTWQARDEDKVQRLKADRAAAAAVIDDEPAGFLREDKALAVLDAYGLPVPAHKLCTSAEQAAEFADRIGYPAVLRMVSPQIIHKSEVQGVVLGLDSAEAVRRAFEQMKDNLAAAMPDAEFVGAIVVRQIPAGHEVILGVKRDAAFGATIMFGLGGLFVETFRDVTFALAPLGPAAAGRMVRQVKAYGILAGARGAPAADIQGVEQCLLRVSQLADDFERISELDVNPLIVGPGPDACAIADVRIRLS